VIPRYQQVIFIALLVASLIMGVVLWRLRERAHERLVAGEDSAHTQAPQVAPAEQATLLVANDTDGSLLAQVQSLPLPADPGARARAILGRLLDLYAAPGSNHPVDGGANSVAQVFLMPMPGESSVGPGDAESGSAARVSGSAAPGSLLAVVNLAAGFAAGHPSGIETETLTVLSICGTLHANLPRVTEVRFLVDGQPRATLAGHADLTRTYLAAEAAPSQGTQP
jgi:sporulation and spore germination protein